MANIKFIYGNNIFEMIKEDRDLLIKDILLKFASIIYKDIQYLYFF